MKLLPNELDEVFLCDLFGWTEQQLHETSISHIQKRLLMLDMKEKARSIQAAQNQNK